MTREEYTKAVADETLDDELAGSINYFEVLEQVAEFERNLPDYLGQEDEGF